MKQTGVGTRLNCRMQTLDTRTVLHALVALAVLASTAITPAAAAPTDQDVDVDVVVEGSEDGVTVTLVANDREETITVPPSELPAPPTTQTAQESVDVDVVVEGSGEGVTVTVSANDQEESITLPPEGSPAPEVPGLPSL